MSGPSDKAMLDGLKAWMDYWDSQPHDYTGGEGNGERECPAWDRRVEHKSPGTWPKSSQGK